MKTLEQQRNRNSKKHLLLITGGILVLVICLFALFGYAVSWSDRFLAPIHQGMTKAQVHSLIGVPLRMRTNDSSEMWSYTRSWSRDANVYFDTNGIVWGVETD